MMKILLVEDDDNKQSQLLGVLRDQCPGHQIVLARSYQSGLQHIKTQLFDLMLLDMSIPTFDVSVEEEGGRALVFGGRQLLRQMERRQIKSSVIVITQYDKCGEPGETKTREELARDLKASRAENYCGMVYYDASSEEWKDELARVIGVVTRSDGEGGTL